MPKFETEIEITLDNAWDKSTPEEQDKLFYDILTNYYVDQQLDKLIQAINDALPRNIVIKKEAK